MATDRIVMLQFNKSSSDLVQLISIAVQGNDTEAIETGILWERD